MTPYQEFLLVAGMALVTFSVRYPVLALVSRVTLPPALLSTLKYIPPAVLAAIITPAILAPNGNTLELGITNAYLVGGLAAILLAWRIRNLLVTITVGMLLFWSWRWLLSISGWT